jgi:hypothetical protein
MTTKIDKRRMKKAWLRHRRIAGTPSYSDAQEAYGLGVISKRTFSKIKKPKKIYGKIRSML